MAAEPPADKEALKSIVRIEEREGIPLSATSAEQRDVKMSITNIFGLVTSRYA
jgi:hypothetical protein